jgi:hypothetical protein
MSNKPSKPSKVQPRFEPRREIACNHECVIVADTEGKLWRIDLSVGHARAVSFGAE